MIDALRRVFRPIGRQRTEEADTLIHAIRNETQVTEGQRHLMQREREAHERTGHFWRDALRGGSPPDPEDRS